MLEQVTLSGQITPDDVVALASQGVKTIVNNRPDDEEPNQPKSDEIAKACEKLGIVYKHIPFAGGAMQLEHVQQFADFYNSSERPLHVFCRTGNRSNGLINQAIAMDLLDD